MSITYNLRKQGIIDTVQIPGFEISGFLLQKLLSDKLKTKEQDLLLFNAYTGIKINPMEIIKEKSTVHVQRLMKPQTKISVAGIVPNQQLVEMGKKARFFMIKSSNQENIQKARDCSVWATTHSNQDKLRSALLYTSHVFLFFATNRSYEIKGFARMEKQPSKIAEKSFWSGVSNIRLGGNFQIRWIRKQPLTSLQIQKVLGAQIKDRVMRLSDGEQVDSQLAQKILPLFEVPNEPYYAVKQQQPPVNNNIEPNKKILNLGQILGAPLITTVFPAPLPPPTKSSPQIKIASPVVQKKQQKQQKNQKQKKQKKKKKKKHRKQSSDQSSSSSSSSSYYSDSGSRSSSSGSSSNSNRKKKKIKKSKDEKRKQRKRSRSRDKKKKEKRSKKQTKHKKRNKN